MPADGMALPLKKGFRHVPMGSSWVRLAHLGDQETGLHVGDWHFADKLTAQGFVAYWARADIGRPWR
jgi:hypothetical protein